MEKKKLKSNLAVLADNILISENNKISVIGIFTQLYATKLPTTHPQMAFLVVVKGAEENSKEKFKIKILSPSGESILDGEREIQFSNTGEANIITNFQMISFNETGNYKFLLEMKNDQIAACNLEVIKVKDPDGTKLKS